MVRSVKELVLLQIIGTVIIIAIDLVYLSSQRDFYKPITDLSGGRLRVIPAVMSWFVIVLGIQLFILSRDDVNSWRQAVVKGALLGLIGYGIYNTTNLATIEKWTVRLAVGDTLWGMILMGGMSGILYSIRERLQMKNLL